MGVNNATHNLLCSGHSTVAHTACAARRRPVRASMASSRTPLAQACARHAAARWGRWDFDLGRDTRIVFIRQDNLNKMTAGFFPFLGRVASPGDIVVINSGLHYNNDYAGTARPHTHRFRPLSSAAAHISLACWGVRVAASLSKCIFCCRLDAGRGAGRRQSSVHDPLLACAQASCACSRTGAWPRGGAA